MGSNRTFMELKCLIKKKHKKVKGCSNRPFMELKCININKGAVRAGMF